MKKILGLDIGTNSIGWAVVEHDEKNGTGKILDAGVRIVSSDATYADAYSKGQAVTKNSDRRQKRSMRRNLQRYKLRRQRLMDLLKAHGMFPGEELIHLDALTLYGLRDRAVRGEKLTPQEIGRILLHLNQKRGYKSNRKANPDAEEGTEKSSEPTGDDFRDGYLDRIEDIEEFLLKNQLTVGQFCLEVLNEKINGFPDKKLRGNIFLRKAHVREFDEIWAQQQRHHPQLLTEELRTKIRDKTIYYQRPLKSAKHLVGRCRFESYQRSAHRSHPVFQSFNVWQHLNNLVLSNVSKANMEDYNSRGERSLTLQEKQHAYQYLIKNGTVKPRKFIKEALGLNPNAGYNLKFEDIQGHLTLHRIGKVLLEADAKRWDYFLDFDPVGVLEEQPAFRLWHALYSIEDPDHLVQALQNQFGFEESLAKQLLKVRLPSDYGSLSVKAMRRLLPYLQQGMTYDKACMEVANATGIDAYRSQMLTTVDAVLNRELKDAIDPIKTNSLRNPVVEQILNQVRNVVNALLKRKDLITEEERLSGQFEIRVELARSLKKSAKQREAETKIIAANKREHERILQILIDGGLKNPSRRDIIKYKLWEECGGISPYTQEKIQVIPIHKLFDRNLYEVEHIIPRARYYNDSFTNKTIVETSVNKEKGKRTAYEYMKDKGRLEAYTHWVNQSKLPNNKKFLLLCDDLNGEEFQKRFGFINRQINETAYISQVVTGLLKQVARNVGASSGEATARLRDKWGVEDTIEKLMKPLFREVGMTVVTQDKDGKSYENIKDWGKRSDHRHHALDAIITAFTTQSYIQFLNTAHAADGRGEEGKYEKQPPYREFRQEVKNVLESLMISHRQNNKVLTKNQNKYKHSNSKNIPQPTLIPRGQLHKETVYGSVLQYKKVPLNTRFTAWEQMVHDEEKALVLERLEAHRMDPKQAFKGYEKNPIYKDEAREKPLTEVTIFERRFVTRVTVNMNFNPKHLPDLVDEGARKAIQTRMEAYKGDPKKAFKDLEKEPLYLETEKGKVKIKKVRKFVGYEDLLALGTDDKGAPAHFVQTGNNHHIAFYKTDDGKLIEQAVSFWDAVERARTGAPVVQQEFNGAPLWLTLQANDMFLMGLAPDQIDWKDGALLSKHLYRVQKISSCDYYFRHHLATSVLDTSELKSARIYLRLNSTKALMSEHPTKVWIDILGKIQPYR